MKHEKHTDHFLILNIILPLMAGGIGYYFLYPSSFLAEIIDRYLKINIHVTLNDNVFIRLIRNYLLDALWVYSLESALVWISSYNRTSPIFMILSLSSGVIFEFFQLSGIVRGTFDLFDICAEMISVLIGWFIICKKYGGN